MLDPSLSDADKATCKSASQTECVVLYCPTSYLKTTSPTTNPDPTKPITLSDKDQQYLPTCIKINCPSGAQQCLQQSLQSTQKLPIQAVESLVQQGGVTVSQTGQVVSQVTDNQRIRSEERRVGKE